MNHWQKIEQQIANAMREVCALNPDPSHDFSHVQRVVVLAKKLANEESAELEVVIPATYLHDFEFVAKTDSRRTQASNLSAKKAVGYLKSLAYPDEYLEGIFHAIEAHSFSAGIKAKTLEAKIVQDADRLDGLGAIGVARCFSLSGLVRRDFYNLDDPFCDQRQPNDQSNSLDHFFVKLLKVPDMLHTPAARHEGKLRAQFLVQFLDQLRREIS